MRTGGWEVSLVGSTKKATQKLGYKPGQPYQFTAELDRRVLTLTFNVTHY